VKLKLRPSEIQPSSTSIRWIIDNREVDIGRPLVPLHEMAEVFKLIAETRPERIRLEISDLVKLLSPEGVNWGLYVEDEKPDYDVYMVVIDLEGHCPFKCPWCYAGEDKYEKPILHLRVSEIEGSRDSIESLLREVLEQIDRSEWRVAGYVAGGEERQTHVTVTLGGSGDPTAISKLPLVLEELCGVLAELRREYRRRNIHLAFALSTSDPSLLLDDDVLDALRCIAVEMPTEVSISYHSPYERRYIRNLPYRYLATLREAVNRALDSKLRVSLQIMIYNTLLAENYDLMTDELDPVSLYDMVDELAEILRGARRLEYFSLYFLRYYEVPWFSGLKPTDRPAATIAMLLRNVVSIAYERNIDSIGLDTCLATEIFGRPFYMYEQGRIYRVKPLSGVIERVEGCPRGERCQVAGSAP